MPLRSCHFYRRAGRYSGYLKIDEKSKVEMIPLSKKRFLIEIK